MVGVLSRRWVFASVLVAVMASFFLAARFLPPVDTGWPSMAVIDGYTNQLLPLLAILLAGAIVLGGLVYMRGQDALPFATRDSQAARGWRWHVLAAALLCLLVVNLAPLWSQPGAYFGRRVMLMDAGERPYVDFEYGYGYLTAYAPYLFHQAGLSIQASLQLALSLAVVLGVLSLAAITRRWVPGPRYRVCLLWLLVACEVFAAPGPSLNYNFCRYALPFVLLGGLADRLPTAGPATAFAATFLANVVVYGISPEMGCALSVACMAWLSIAWVEAPARTVLAAMLAVAAAVAVTLIFAWPMFATMLQLTQNQVGRPVTPHLMMVLAVGSFLVTAAAAVAAALTAWRSAAQGRRAVAASTFCACAALAAALLPALVCRAWPAITLAYGFASIVMLVGQLVAAGAKVPATLLTLALAAFVAWVGLPEARADISRIHATLAGVGTGSRPVAGDTKQLLLRFPHALDPVGAAPFAEPPLAKVGFFPGLAGGDALTPAAFARKFAEVRAASYYILPSDPHALEREPADPSNITWRRFDTVGLWPFHIKPVRSLASPRSAFIRAIYARCRLLAAASSTMVCAYN